MTRSFDVAGFTLTIGSIVAALAVAQWLVMILAGAFSRAKMPKSGMRPADKRLLASTIVFALAWAAVFATGWKAPQTSAAAVVATRSHGSCSQVTNGMLSSVVKNKLGEPDEIRSDQETRGPGAAIWIYRDSRCAVHIFDDKVEFID